MAAYERQVDVLRRNDSALAQRHIGLLNGWAIKLSDLGATNYAISIVLTIGLQVFAIITSARHSMDSGTLLSILLYVFEFSAAAALLPMSWQEYLRLCDILRRLRQGDCQKAKRGLSTRPRKNGTCQGAAAIVRRTGGVFTGLLVLLQRAARTSRPRSAVGSRVESSTS